MARESVIRNPVRKGYAVLTPEVFRSLDIRTRKQVSAVLKICAPDKMQGFWGRVHMMAGGVFTDVRLLSDEKYDGPIYLDANDIEISNQILISDFHGAQRPEIDLAVIPADRAYDYLVWHEIGHLMDNFDPWGLFVNGVRELFENDDEARHAHYKLNEIMADRFAWSRMFPGQQMAVRRGQAHVKTWAQEWEHRFTDAGVRRRTGSSHRKSAEPWAYVPIDHVRKGIPWSDLVKPEEIGASRWESCIARAQADVHASDLRSFRKLAKTMQAKWSQIADASPQEAEGAMNYYNRTGHVHGFMLEEEKQALIQRHSAAKEVCV